MNAPEAFRAHMAAALGPAALVPQSIVPGKLHRFRTAKRGSPSGWCRLFEDGLAGVYGCFRLGLSQVWTAQPQQRMTAAERAALQRQVAQAQAERQQEQQDAWAKNEERNRAIWVGCSRLVPSDAATLYLKTRGLGAVWPLPDCLRLHPALPYWNDGELLGEFPAMVAPLVRAGRTVALHRTYLAKDGRKAPVPSPKKLSGASGPVLGASIPLLPPRAGLLGVGEGIETALAAWCASGVPTVAAYSAGNLARFHWPDGLRRLLVFADADAAGREAAEELRKRAVAAKLSVRVLTPSEDGADWADLWARGKGVTV